MGDTAPAGDGGQPRQSNGQRPEPLAAALARRINDYTFFDYDQREALHLSEREQTLITAFHQQLREYFVSGHPERRSAEGRLLPTGRKNGLPTVAYFADKACLSPNYFGDLISKESGTTAQRHIQDAVIERSKQLLVETRLPVSEIAYQLGFEYPQHFSRLFKSRTGMTPNEYRLTA